jgi:hypothetical protein
MVAEILTKTLAFFIAVIDTLLELIGVQTGPNWPSE